MCLRALFEAICRSIAECEDGESHPRKSVVIVQLHVASDIRFMSYVICCRMYILGHLRGYLVSTLEQLGSTLGPSGAMSGPCWGHFGRSWGILGFTLGVRV